MPRGTFTLLVAVCLLSGCISKWRLEKLINERKAELESEAQAEREVQVQKKAQEAMKDAIDTDLPAKDLSRPAN